MANKYFWRARRRLRDLAGHEFPPVIFLHIPKTAGSSISYHFRSNIGPIRSPRTFNFYSWDEQQEIEDKLSRIGQNTFLFGHFGWQHVAHLIPRSFSIVSLRDPIDRTLSFYKYLRNLPAAEMNTVFPCREAKELNFEDFCNSGSDAVNRAIVNPQVRTLHSDAICSGPSIDFDSEELLSVAINHLQKFSFVTLTEHLDGDLTLISKLTETTLKKDGHRRNVSGDGRIETSRQEAVEILGDRIRLDKALYETAKEIRQAKLLEFGAS